ncbi:hypothetical protein [Paracoccus methylarcula]|uniref:Uncharacterized protein n=1 Tax=Paracoccus methylarcula TaxID=72022 RepID=A0A3R7LP53_9RHOB|nr:hypothetical protein [Paracoccus methylarcula]RNF33998.1 hypothetical protein A7A09_013930 [Paracoccus methylarcula]
MRNLASRARSWFFLAIVLVVPATTQADSITVTICAHPEGFPKQTIQANLKVLRSGAVIPTTPQPLSDSCVRVDLPACDGTVMIEASVPRTYSGKLACSTDPTPMLIAMQADRVEILTASIADAWGDGLPGFDQQSFIADIIRTDTILSELPVEGQQSVNALYAALAARNYPEAQRQASETAAYLRGIEEVKLSLAYSSITYVAGFRAIGVDALASENPLVSVGPTPSSVVLNKEGRNVLGLYQAARAIPAEPGVWDSATTANIATVISLDAEGNAEDEFMKTRGAIVPQAFSANDFSIEPTGRMVFH